MILLDSMIYSSHTILLCDGTGARYAIAIDIGRAIGGPSRSTSMGVDIQKYDRVCVNLTCRKLP